MDAGPTIDPQVRAYVEQAVTALVRPDELDHWSLAWESYDDGVRLVCRVTARGESFTGFVTHRGAVYPVAHGLDNFTNGLEDFVSESRFAWGERRELHERPWSAG